MEDCNEKGKNSKGCDELERRLRAGLHREAQNLRLDAEGFWTKFVTKSTNKI